MFLNVNREVKDASNRYKMPRLIANVERKGNGVITVIPNMPDIARALGRPPTYCTKFFGYELGAQTHFDLKNDRYIVSGNYDAATLQDKLDIFIKKFVLCKKCDNPETDLEVLSKRGMITASCRECGHSFTLDMSHKLTTFIVKNPPEIALKGQGTSVTQRKATSIKRKDDINGDSSKNGDDALSGENNEEEVEWFTDTSEQAVLERMRDLSTGVIGKWRKNMETTEKKKMNIFNTFVKTKIDGGELTQLDEEEILAKAERLDIVNKATIVLCEVILGSNKVLAQITQNRRLFIRFTKKNQNAQMYLIGGIEKLIEERENVLLPKATAILNAFYDADILDEEVILEWGKKATEKYVSKELSENIHKQCEPFLNFLKEAEEESDSESDEHIKLEFERLYSSCMREKKNNPSKNRKEEPKKKKVAANGNGDDDVLDILYPSANLKLL